MTSQNRFLDDLSKLMNNAMGVAQGAKNEAETAVKGWIDRWLAERDFVTREEFEVVREMAVKSRTEATELRARLDRLDPAGAAPAAPAVEPVSEVEAPASQAMGDAGASRATEARRGDPVSEAEAPPSGAMGDNAPGR
ncbi:accessory factor UbiK family protein [Paracoccus sp. S-4012]|nr:accessory factor UbiK family protein [Paracoccus sp. S-4012]